MKNWGIEILNRWFAALNGNVSSPIYRFENPNSNELAYTILRIESDSRRANQHKFLTRPVVITDVVKKYGSAEAIDAGDAINMDSEIYLIIYPSTAFSGLTSATGFRIVKVEPQDKQYLIEDDGTNKIVRIITRNVHTIEEI